MRRLTIRYIRAGRPVLPIWTKTCTNSSLVMLALMATAPSDICTISLMILNVFGISLACSSSISCSRFAGLRGDLSEGEKNHKKGGWIVFSKTFLSCVLKNCSQIQSLTWVQSLSAADNRREQRKKEHKQLYRFLPQTGSSPLPLELPRRVPLKCNIGLQVVQTLK